MDRFVEPEEVRLDLSRGDWILVRKELNLGEQRKMFAATATAPAFEQGARVQIAIKRLGVSTVAAYLLDWSLKNRAGQVIPIREQGLEAVMSALYSLNLETFNEIEAALDRHQTAVDQEKKRPAIAIVS